MGVLGDQFSGLDHALQRVNSVSERLDRLLDAQEIERANISGIKLFYLPLMTFTGTNPLTIGGDSNAGLQSTAIDFTPNVGYVWMIRALTITGLTFGTTPDVVNIFTGNRYRWQLNGNSPVSTFGRMEMPFWPNETPQLRSQGTFAATGQITFSGWAEQVPAEMIGKLR